MNPFFFGASSEPLFGVHHTPRARAARQTGVVLCAPHGQEYMRAHRAFRQLALLLDKAGFHVLRFDYAGTGDSWGDGTDVSLSTWRADVGAAIDELRAQSDVERVSLVGLRLGAAVAALAARERTDVASVVLWDPVVRGTDYLDELLGDVELPEGVPAATDVRDPAYAGTVNVMGYPLTPRLRRELAAVDLLTALLAAAPHHLVTSSERPEFTALAARQDGSRIVRTHIPSDGDWNYVDNFGSVLIPQLVIQGIVRLLAEEGE